MILPPPSALHRRVGRARAQERAGEVGVEHVVPLGQRVVLRLLADVGARVVHEDVEPAAPVQRGSQQRGDRRLVGHVDRDRERLTAELLELAHRGRGLRLVARRHHDAAPAPASPRAMPRPIPPLPPVTIATFPLRSNMGSSGPHLTRSRETGRGGRARGGRGPRIARTEMTPSWRCAVPSTSRYGSATSASAMARRRSAVRSR